jgi:hypothetical protein
LHSINIITRAGFGAKRGNQGANINQENILIYIKNRPYQLNHSIF